MTNFEDVALKANWVPTPYHHTDCELAALGFVLSQHGLLDTLSMTEINRIVGRQYGETDLSGYSHKLMLHFGCDRVSICDSPLLTEIEPFEEWVAGVACRDGRSADDPAYSPVYELAKRSVRNVGEIYQANMDRYHHEQRPATQADIDELLSAGRHVLIGNVAEVASPGWYWAGAVFAMIPPGRYHAFDIARGLIEVGPEVFLGDQQELFLAGWRLPA